ncbi:MAG TPA: AAA family ATPase [Anaerolineae bacterium]|nr:AAA family ATPase [Anaerolineae bacterium]
MTSQTLYRRNFLLHLQKRPEYDRPVLLKEPAHDQLSVSQIAQLHNEFAVSQQLAHLPGVRPVFAIEGSESHPILLMEYVEGNSLAELIEEGSLDLSQKLQIGVQIATILECIHEEGVMHRDISSSNILVAKDDAPDETGGVTIIGFGLATTTKGEGLSRPIEVEFMTRSVAYMSPEQTGRTNRPVDYRTDLYSLGVTLYELLVGRLPFETDDPMELIHSHLAQEPLPLHEIDASIPRVLSDIILKLLAKDAEERYQSVGGLNADLSNCLRQLQDTGRIESFEIGADDFVHRLILSRKLYGRQAEISQLVAAYDRVAQGNTELLFVAGYSGVGKTSLVHAIREEILVRGGVFVDGKFDQLQRAPPYSAWAQAFTQLAKNWLAESEANLAEWRENILDAVGANGQVLIDVIPSLERVIGPQPDVPELGGIENQNRFNYIFTRFISSLATPDHPLVIFLDDLQWIDRASLNLIETLMDAQSSGSLLIIGAYRDNELSSDHPLVASQNRIRSATERITVIELGDLAADDVNHLLADTLQLDVADCHDLGRVLVEKTAGNPFYFRQLLYALESEEELRFDRQQQRWVWTATLQQSLQASGSVVDMMIGRIRALPVETQRSLSVAACLGSRFETSTLGIITGQPPNVILTDLNPALQAGLILRLNGHYMFAHDRIQEAGYSLIPESVLPNRHLEIGRLLLAATPEEDLEEVIFDIASHLNVGRALIDKAAEKTELAALNLKAGQKAKTASAYADAKKYIEIGLDLLHPDSWQEQYELTLSLHNENGELAYLTGRFDQLAPTVDLIQRNARSVNDQVRIYMIQIEAETAQYNVVEALKIGLEVLRDLGFEIPVQPTEDDHRRLHDIFIGLLKGRQVKKIARLPEMSDERALAASSLFASIMSTSYIINPPLFPIISYNGAILTLEHGLDVWAPFFFGGVTLVNFASVDRGAPVDEALRLIRFYQQLVDVIRELLENPITVRSRSKGLMMLAFTLPWIESIEQSIELSRATFNSGFESGDWLYASYGTIFYSVLGFDAGKNLDTYEGELSAYINNVHRMGYITPAQYASIFLQTALNLKKISPEPHRLIGAFFNEDEWLPDAIKTNDINGRHYFYTGKLILGYHFDIDEKLDEWVGNAGDYLDGGPGMYSSALLHLYFALANLRLASGASSKKLPALMNLINQSLHWMAIWSETAPTTFRHKYDLIEAERARVTGDIDSALSRYEQAIRGAQENRFTHEEALANELYARFWLERGQERFAGPLMREAYSLYRKWGAMAKAEHLAKRYPKLIIGRGVAVDESHTGAIFDQMAGDLDLMTILKASQAIAAEIELGRLLTLLMTGAIENSGAQRGLLLLPEDGQWMIVAQADMDKIDSQVEQPIPVADSDSLSQRIVHYVARAQQTVLLDDATQSGEFVDDPYIRRDEVKSLLCTPLVNQGKTSAILYLENNLSAGSFTPERVELLKLLSSQMAISIDNARTHDRLEQLLEERSRALSSAEAQVRTIFDNSPVGISLTNLEGRFLAVNDATLQMLRISQEEVLQQNVSDFYADPGDRLALLAEVRQSGSAQNFGVQILRYDGSSFFASLNASRLALESEDVLLTMIEDVTDELTAEQEVGAQAERERLARELHDSVSQTLFTAGMIAEAMPRMLEKDQARGRQDLEILSVLIRGASAEMRSLLLELRPDTLKDQTLGQLLKTLVIAARARTQATVSLNEEGDCRLPEEVIIAFHRIAQESLNNIAKHAEASQVAVDLNCDPERTKLSIQDDGRGFDPQLIPAGHLGIGIMRERAYNIGADIEIDSQIGRGTQVSVSWSATGQKYAPGDKTKHE